MNRTAKWPEWSSTFSHRSFPKMSLLAGMEPVVWDALGRLSWSDFEGVGKQVVLRRALRSIGLGWVATNTTPFRIMVGALHDEARRCHDRSRFLLRLSNNHHITDTVSASTKRRRQCDGDPFRVQVLDNPLPECPAISGPLRRGIITAEQRKAVWTHLDCHGACVIRGAVDLQNIIFSALVTTKTKQIQLRETMGNGISGDPPSIYMDLPNQPESWLHELPVESAIWDLLLGDGGKEFEFCKTHLPKRKSIFLRCGLGAENWAHQDNNSEKIPIQAVVLLSEPIKDFRGGEFYVARQEVQDNDSIQVRRSVCAFHSLGDLVLFQAGKGSGWWHGMLPVHAGDAVPKSRDGYIRKAIGMLQP